MWAKNYWPNGNEYWPVLYWPVFEVEPDISNVLGAAAGPFGVNISDVGLFSVTTVDLLIGDTVTTLDDALIDGALVVDVRLSTGSLLDEELIVVTFEESLIDGVLVMDSNNL